MIKKLVICICLLLIMNACTQNQTDQSIGEKVNIIEVDIMPEYIPNKEHTDATLFKYKTSLEYFSTQNFEENDIKPQEISGLWGSYEEMHEILKASNLLHLEDSLAYISEYICDIDHDGEDERVLFLVFRQRDTLVYPYDYVEVLIQKKNNNGSYTTIYNSLNEEDRDWIFYQNESRLSEDTVAVVKLEGVFYIAHDVDEYLRLYSYNSEKNKLILVYEYFIDPPQASKIEEFPEVKQAFFKFKGSVDQFINANIAHDAIRKWERDKRNAGEYSNNQYMENFLEPHIDDEEPIEFYRKLDIYQCDIDNDGKDERILLGFYSTMRPHIEVELDIEKQDSNGKFVFDYNYYNDKKNIASDGERLNYLKFSTTRFSPKVIKIKDKYYIAENRFETLVVSQYDSVNKGLVCKRYQKDKNVFVAKYPSNVESAKSSNESPSNIDKTSAKSLGIKVNAVNELPKLEALQIYHSLKGRKCEMIGKLVGDEKEFWHRIYSGFQFPEKYKENEEDIVAGLKDLSWISQDDYAIFIWDADHLFADQPDIKKRLCSVFEEEIIPFWKDKNKTFTLFLVN